MRADLSKPDGNGRCGRQDGGAAGKRDRQHEPDVEDGHGTAQKVGGGEGDDAGQIDQQREHL
eukprot:scaffold5861_cov126-Isochrysis_galbana.AAC.1